jgi:hypothetical protein
MAINSRPTPELQISSCVYCHSFLRQDEIHLFKEKAHTSTLVKYKRLNQKVISARLEIYERENIELRKEIHHEFVSYIYG